MCVADVILDQIRGGVADDGSDGSTCLKCWGARDFEVYSPDSLAFKVSGEKFKGIVIVSLEEDTGLYEVEFFTVNKYAMRLKDRLVGVLRDKLTRLIDRQIEVALDI